MGGWVGGTAHLRNDCDLRPKGAKGHVGTIHAVQGHPAARHLADTEQGGAEGALATPTAPHDTHLQAARRQGGPTRGERGGGARRNGTWCGM
jgi:hypothetical protein